MENGQARTSSFEHLDYCCRLVSELYGKPDISAWTNGDYIRLGYILYKKTHVQISPNTLKRIFGKIKTNVRYYPQKATRDALASYVGFADWEKFVTAKPVPETVTKPSSEHLVNPIPTFKPVLTPAQPPFKIKWISYVAVLVLIVLAVVVYRFILVDPEPENVSLVCYNPVGQNPHSAAFVIRGMSRSSEKDPHYSIEFGDGRKMAVMPGDSLHSHYYEVPGRYLAVLKQNKIALDTVAVYLQTKGWTATGEMMYDTTRVYPVEKSNLLSGRKITVNAMEVARAGMDTNRTFFIKFVNTKFTDIDGDNFDLHVTLQTSPSRPGVRCSQVRLNVFGETTKHLVDAMKPGCEHWTDMQFSEIAKPGETNQLDFLGVDLHEGGSMELKVVNKHAEVFINSKKVFETDYQQALKKIYGLGITFSGIGSIQSVMLKDLKTGKLFDGNF
jgi:hypothetical protein